MTTTTLTRTTEVTRQSSREELARRAARLLTTPPEARDAAATAEVFAPEVRFLGPAAYACGGPARPEHHLGGAFSAVHADVRSLEVDGDRAVARVAITGRHTSTFEGCAASGDLRRADCVISMRIDRDRVVEVWSVLRWTS